MNGKIIKTKQRLLDALTELAKTQTLQEISVSSLCRQANVNRATFYKYYTMPRDVLSEYLHDLMAENVPDYMDMTRDTDLYEILVAICRICYNHRNLLSLLKATQEDILALMVPFFPSQNHGIEKESRLYFITGGVTGLLMQWVTEGYKQPPERIARLMEEYISLLR